MNKKLVIHWFRQDLRVADNPSLNHASKNESVLPIYILDDVNAEEMGLGSASRWWLHHSLESLNHSLDNSLSLYIGDAKKVIKDLVKRFNITGVYWNRCYEPWRIQRDKEIKSLLEGEGIDVQSFNASLLWEPWEVKKADGTPYKVFTPFYRKGCLQVSAPREPLRKPRKLTCFYNKTSASIEDLNLLPEIPWDITIANEWKVGEQHAKKQLSTFLKNGIQDYKKGRNFPAKKNVSRLSPYLHFGEISPHQIWSALKNLPSNDSTEHFKSELGWREFSHSLLYYSPTLAEDNLQAKFNHFPWSSNKKYLRAWQQGLTGYPIVDAGMRELWQTGYIHNRVRMIVGSFLVKNLLLHWRDGFTWFWDCLLDADHANNAASWQWVAGCGADAAPYFRIFNPVLQGQKFDPDGEYTKKYVPELDRMPTKYLFNPWEAPKEILDEAGITLGDSYPKPIVNSKQSREKALSAFQTLRKFS